MAQEQHRWSVERTIASEKGASRPVIDELLKRMEQSGWSEHEAFAVRLAVEEALVNASKHGNGWDTTKRVHFQWQLSGQQLSIRVSDEGPGFDPKAVPDCTEPENLDRPSGRGILLMRSYMTRVEYNELGNVVVLEKIRGK